MAYLLDTNVISELRRPNPNRRVMYWIEKVPAADLFLSAVTIGAIQAGIEMTREQDAEKAAEIETLQLRNGNQTAVAPCSIVAENRLALVTGLERAARTLRREPVFAIATGKLHHPQSQHDRHLRPSYN